MVSPVDDFHLSCPLPIARYPAVTLAHGGGGTLMHDLIENMFKVAFGLDADDPDFAHDSAVFKIPGDQRLAFTTDSFVVSPLFFPGGDIGALAVYGTVNDLAMSGARPLYLSVGFILEEGLPMEVLWRIVTSMREAARGAGVRIITGDTKVVEKGKADGIFINTSGIGVVSSGIRIGAKEIRDGDEILISGDLGRHGMAIMAQRENLEFESQIESDAAPLAGLVERLLARGIQVRCLRDLTRGGLASALNELAVCAGKSIEIEERAIPVREDVRGACALLGLDPLYVACEGRCVIFVPPSDVDEALRILRADPLGQGAARMGRVLSGPSGEVTMKSVIGVKRIVDMISGEQLPRIC